MRGIDTITEDEVEVLLSRCRIEADKAVKRGQPVEQFVGDRDDMAQEVAASILGYWAVKGVPDSEWFPQQTSMYARNCARHATGKSYYAAHNPMRSGLQRRGLVSVEDGELRPRSRMPDTDRVDHLDEADSVLRRVNASERSVQVYVLVHRDGCSMAEAGRRVGIGRERARQMCENVQAMIDRIVGNQGA